MRECEIKASSRDVMLRSVRDMIGYTVYGSDGEVGQLTDFYFDDEKWVIRHFVVEMDDRIVLLSPIAFAAADWHAKLIRMDMTVQQIHDSPEIDTSRPISRQTEKDYYDFYGWPYYWGGTYAWGTGMYPYQAGIMAVPVNEDDESEMAFTVENELDDTDTHLRSAEDLIGYHAEALEGGVGKVKDFIFDDACFDIRFVVIDTASFWSKNEVMIPVSNITSVEWPERKIYLKASREQVKSSPHWDASKHITPAYMEELTNHYNK